MFERDRTLLSALNGVPATRIVATDVMLLPAQPLSWPDRIRTVAARDRAFAASANS